MFKKILVILLIFTMFVCSVNAIKLGDYKVGDNVSNAFPNLPARSIYPMSKEQKSLIMPMANVGGLEENSSTHIVEMWLVDPSSVLLAEFTDTGQWQYVDEGDELKVIWVFVNVSKAYCADWDEALNNTAVFITFMPLAEDPIVEGYFYIPGSGVREYADCFQVGFYYTFAVPYEFESGIYLIYLEYYVYY
jgi:hypothetical protein